MKIYCYLKHFPLEKDPHSEGVCKAVHGLASGLVQQGASVTVLCEGTPSGQRLTPAGYEIQCFPSEGSSPSWNLAPELQQFLQTQFTGADATAAIVILNGIFHRSVAAVAQQLHKLRVPYIVAPHDPYHPTIFQKNAHLKWPYWFLVEKRLLQQATAIQVLDAQHQQWLSRLGIRTPIVALPNGFEPQDVLPEADLQWHNPATARFFFLGRLDAYNKGLDLLVDAFAQYQQSATAASHLTLQGSDWGDRATLEAQVKRLNLSETVKFLSPDYHTSPSQLAVQYDVFCMPSRFEGFSLSALEAMLAGRVLLVSEVAGIATHVQASGCGVVVQATAESIAQGMTKLWNCRDRWPEMGLKGRQYALDNLRWDKIAQQALQQYSRLEMV
ncbi:glycosyltransferase [Alkalinema sp. FACHB-956]|uniref:glycosyltransferase n=1 Tax=Alkalinema sp. FACHB-956 TaxID=2692768 RepID=UPI0016863F67|nr:glycosyltransferase [Alkalinema sp. FACHB-956]MBD2327261.1 glycosyltransferase [Alkalinema sp. FACHB-956]